MTTSSWGDFYRLVASEKWKEKSAAMGRDVTLALVEYANPKPGMHVLDLAAGTGEPAITIASRLAGTGEVVATDLSAELLEIAEGRARSRNLSNFTIQQADAHQLPFPGNTFDLATSRFGVMFFADVEKALTELRRVLTRGARGCFAAWGPFDQPYWSSTMGVVLAHVGGPLLEPNGPNPFRFAQPGSLSAGLRLAGFKDIHEETRTVPWTWPGTSEEVWEQAKAVAAPFRPLLARVPKAEWEKVDREVRVAIQKCVKDGEIRFGATIVLASGTNP
jgi:SAM-dependent methyltransferase